VVGADRARHGARALCIVVLRTVSDPEGSSTKEERDECRRLPGLHGGLGTFVLVLDKNLSRNGTSPQNRLDSLLGAIRGLREPPCAVEQPIHLFEPFTFFEGLDRNLDAAHVALDKPGEHRRLGEPGFRDKAKSGADDEPPGRL